MGIFLAYSLKSAVCLALFYLFYKVLLSKETFHRFNRFALLCIVGLAIGIPFLATLSQQTGVGQDSFPQVAVAMDEIKASVVNTHPEENGAQHNWIVILLFVYLAGVCFCLLRSICGIIRIVWLIRKGKCTMYGGKIKIFVHRNKQIAPFSWMKYIVISQADLDEAGEAILMHEQAHIRYRHTIDLFLAELCILFQWYNPAAWLLYRELQTIHEFEADKSVIDQGIDAKQYQLLLIKKAVGTRLYSMANSFNHSNLKKRITMMLQKKSSSWARLKYVYVLPLAAITVVAFARPEISQPFKEISSVKVSHFIATTEPSKVENVLSEVVEPLKIVNEVIQPTLLAPENSVDNAIAVTLGFPEGLDAGDASSEIIQPIGVINEVRLPIPVAQDDSVYKVVEVMPEFPGGVHAIMKFLADNIVYPKNMQEAGIQGRVIVSFVITKEGHVRDAKVVSSLHPEGDAEALRVVSIMPQWKPGKMKGKDVNVKYTLPMNYRLKKG